jgi:glycosyltransferase involved in cell wall biosynthesis
MVVSLKILWHSNAPYLNSAYGLQTALFAKRINERTDHEIVAISAPYSGAGTFLEWEGIPVLPAVRDQAGCDVLPQHYEYFKADILISLCDPFGLLKCASALSATNWFPWFPVDCSPLGEGDVTVLREAKCTTPIAMSRFGEIMLQREGAEPLYIPHGVDTSVFAPGDSTKYRETVPALDQDTFVIGIVGMNRGRRKAFDQQLLAFSSFHARHPDTHLSIHSAQLSPGGTNLPGLAARLGISDAVSFPDAYMYDTGQVTNEQMAVWYNGLDILSLCSYGEGFGVPLIEAQACGIPVVTTDASATSELCGAGWLVSGTPDWEDGHGAWWTRPDATDIDQAYESAYQAKQDSLLPRKPAWDFAQKFDVEKVFNDHWVPVLNQIEESLS